VKLIEPKVTIASFGEKDSEPKTTEQHFNISFNEEIGVPTTIPEKTAKDSYEANDDY